LRYEKQRGSAITPSPAEAESTAAKQLTSRIDGSTTDAAGMAELFVPHIDPDGDTLTAALAYAKAGFYVLPVRRGSKHPGSVVGDRWHHQSSRDPEQIVAWFAGTNHCIALHIGRSGGVVLDVDNPERLPKVLADSIEHDQPPYQSTRADVPGRGHYLYAVPPGRRLGNSTGKLGKGWGEIRGTNGVIVVAPSVHELAASGGRYEWLRTGAVPVLPEQISALLPEGGISEDAVSDAYLSAFTATLIGNSHPKRLDRVLDWYGDEVAAGAARHDTALRAACWLARGAQAGDYRAEAAFAALGEAFTASLAVGRNGSDRVVSPAVAVSEYAGILSWAVGQVGSGGAGPDGGEELPSDSPTGRLGVVLTRSELASLPNVAPLIDGLMSYPASVLMVGATGVGKTFTALAVACCTATGHEWLGRRVVRRRVLYVIGEGAYGLDERITAWEHAWNSGTSVPDEWLTVIVKPSSLSEQATWTQLAAYATRGGYGLVMLDTFSSLAPDADETKDAAQTMRRLSDLSAAIDGCAVLVHHPGWSDSGRARGGYQLEANADEVLILRDVAEGSNLFTMTRKKVKDGPSGEVHWLHRSPSHGSVIIEGTRSDDASVPMRARILAVLTSCGDIGATGPQLMEEIGVDAKSRSGFYQALRKLRDEGSIHDEGSRSAKRYYLVVDPPPPETSAA
jgi:hypothetical protein